MGLRAHSPLPQSSSQNRPSERPPGWSPRGMPARRRLPTDTRPASWTASRAARSSTRTRPPGTKAAW